MNGPLQQIKKILCDDLVGTCANSCAELAKEDRFTPHQLDRMILLDEFWLKMTMQVATDPHFAEKLNLEFLEQGS